jgi:hypothetical protein
MSETAIGVVQSVYTGFGYISAGCEGGSAIYFSLANVVGEGVLVGDRVRFVRQNHGRQAAVNVQVIPKDRPVAA